MAGNSNSGPPKGETNNPNGRPKGVPNKTTKEIRDAYQMLLENNTANLEKWLSKVAETNPAKAIELMSNLSEYILPKLSRAEVKAEIEQKGVIDLSKLPQDVLDKLIDESNDTGTKD